MCTLHIQTHRMCMCHFFNFVICKQSEMYFEYLPLSPPRVKNDFNMQVDYVDKQHDYVDMQLTYKCSMQPT